MHRREGGKETSKEREREQKITMFERKQMSRNYNVQFSWCYIWLFVNDYHLDVRESNTSGKKNKVHLKQSAPETNGREEGEERQKSIKQTECTKQTKERF
jgi:hypothetical protein